MFCRLNCTASNFCAVVFVLLLIVIVCMECLKLVLGFIPFTLMLIMVVGIIKKLPKGNSAVCSNPME